MANWSISNLIRYTLRFSKADIRQGCEGAAKLCDDMAEKNYLFPLAISKISIKNSTEEA